MMPARFPRGWLRIRSLRILLRDALGMARASSSKRERNRPSCVLSTDANCLLLHVD